MKTPQLLVTAAVAGILSVGTVSHAANSHAKKATGQCTQANDCGGKGACKGMTKDSGKWVKNACAGKNSCANHVITDTTEEHCKALHGTFSKS